MSDDQFRGDLGNPLHALQAEVMKALERYPEVLEAQPGYVAALLIEYGDTLRDLNDLEHDVEEQGEGVWTVDVGEEFTAWIGAPREGLYGDVDVQELNELLDQDVTEEIND